MASPPTRSKRSPRRTAPDQNSSPIVGSQGTSLPSSRPPSYYEDSTQITAPIFSSPPGPYLAQQTAPYFTHPPAYARIEGSPNPRASWAPPSLASGSFIGAGWPKKSGQAEAVRPPAYSLSHNPPTGPSTISSSLPSCGKDDLETKTRRALDFEGEGGRPLDLNEGPPPYEDVVGSSGRTPIIGQGPPSTRNGQSSGATESSTSVTMAGDRMMVTNRNYHAPSNNLVARRAARYRSNSSLELDRLEVAEDVASPGGTLRRHRDYGSSGSVDLMGSNNEFFEMVKNYSLDQTLDQRSPAPAAMRDILQGSSAVSGLSSRVSGPIHEDFDLKTPNSDSVAAATPYRGQPPFKPDVEQPAPSTGATMSDTEGTEVAQSPRMKSKAAKMKERKQNRSKSVIQDRSTSFFGKLRGGASGGSGGAALSRHPNVGGVNGVDSDSGLSTSQRSSEFDVVFPPEALRGATGASLAAIASNPPSGGGSAASAASAALVDGGGSTRRTVMHHDLQSVMFSFHDVVASKRLAASQRRNTTTGASAASAVGSGGRVHGGAAKEGQNVPTTTVNDTEYDAGDDKNNLLVRSCPFFRNELGGENFSGIFNVSLIESPFYGSPGPPGEEDPGGGGRGRGERGDMETSLGANSLIEHCDRGALYYRNFFHGRDHQNYFGNDENFGPVAISIRRERVDTNNNLNQAICVGNGVNNGPSTADASSQPTPPFNAIYQYRVIVRTSELRTLRGAILEDDVPSASRHGGARGLPPKDVLEAVTPELQLSALRLAQTGERVQEQLLKLDEQGISTTYKVGIMYCRADQSSEEEMYNNERAGPNFDKFLDLLGERVRLKGFEKYRAQLDNKTDSTGTHSLYSCFDGCEIMFHVSTLLPYTQNNRQQLLRKRHIGNDIVTIVFQEPGAHPFTPKAVRSQFQHVFIVIQLTTESKYSVAVSRSKDVPPFGPPISADGCFEHSSAFRDFLLAKVINAENAAHKSEKFRAMATRTRQEYLKDLANNHVTSTTLESSSKFAKFSMKKKDRPKSHVPPLESQLRPAVVWSVCLEDLVGSFKRTPCYLAISATALALVDKVTGDIICFVLNSNVIGWTEADESLKLYYDHGCCLFLQLHLTQDKRDILHRLSQVSPGCLAREVSLRRNAMGQLGFHVYSQGLVMEVEPHGPAWQSGLRPGSRLLEICKVVVAELTHEEMVELLRTSVVVTVLAVAPRDDGSPRGLVDNSDGDVSLTDDSILSPSSSNITLDDAATSTLPSTGSSSTAFATSSTFASSTLASTASDSSVTSRSSDRHPPSYHHAADYESHPGFSTSFQYPTSSNYYGAGPYHPGTAAAPAAASHHSGSAAGPPGHGTMNSTHSSASASSVGSGIVSRDSSGRGSLEGRRSTHSGGDVHPVSGSASVPFSGQPASGQSNASSLNPAHSHPYPPRSSPQSYPHPPRSSPQRLRQPQQQRQEIVVPESQPIYSYPSPQPTGANLSSYPHPPPPQSSQPPTQARALPPQPLLHPEAAREEGAVSRTSHGSSNPSSSRAGSKHGSYEYLSMWSNENGSTGGVPAPTVSAISAAKLQLIPHSISGGSGKQQQPQTAVVAPSTKMPPSSSAAHLVAPSSFSAFTPVTPRALAPASTRQTAPPRPALSRPPAAASSSYANYQQPASWTPKNGEGVSADDDLGALSGGGTASDLAFSRRSKLYSSERVFDPNRRSSAGAANAFPRSRPPLPTSGGVPVVAAVTPTHRREKSGDGDAQVRRAPGGRPVPAAASRASPRGQATVPSGSTTFQQDLMRLIDPDIPESELVNSVGKSAGSTPKKHRAPLHRTLSDESLSGGGATVFSRSNTSGVANPGMPPRHPAAQLPVDGAEAVFTAKPAQIVSPRNLRDHRTALTTSSSDRLYPHTTFASPNQATYSNSVNSAAHAAAPPRLSPSLGAAGPPGRQSGAEDRAAPRNAAFPLPDAAAGNIEWNELVDAADKVFRGSNPDLTSGHVMSAAGPQSSHDRPRPPAAVSVGVPSKPARDPAAVGDGGANLVGCGVSGGEADEFQMSELEIQLKELQEQLQMERLGRVSLEQQMSHLRDDNARLAEESQSAAAQLRRFTEWFFTTVDKS